MQVQKAVRELEEQWGFDQSDEIDRVAASVAELQD